MCGSRCCSYPLVWISKLDDSGSCTSGSCLPSSSSGRPCYSNLPRTACIWMWFSPSRLANLLQEELRVQLRDLRAEEADLTGHSLFIPFHLTSNPLPPTQTRLAGGFGAHGGRFRALRPRRASLRRDYGWPRRPVQWHSCRCKVKSPPSILGAGDAALPELYFEWSMTDCLSLPFYGL